MNKFKYELNIGEYDSDVRCNIDLKIKDGLTSEDYTKIRICFEQIENIVTSYIDESKE